MSRFKLYGSLIRHFLLNLYSVEGSLGGEKLLILVADDGTTIDYISRLAFPDGAVVKRKRPITALRGPSLAESDADVVVVGANRLLIPKYLSHGFRIIPKWLTLFLPVTEEPYARMCSFHRATRREFQKRLERVEQAGFGCETISDTSWLSRFYEDMYKPHALQRFDDTAVVYDIKTLEKFASKGFFIVTTKNGEPAAAIIAYREGDVLRLPFGGVAGGDLGLVKEGATFLTHYCAAQTAHSFGCTHVDFGRSRPFLSDGSLMYKLSWHMEARPSEDINNVFAVATPGNTPQGVRFLQENPHFYIDGNECRKSGGETHE